MKKYKLNQSARKVFNLVKFKLLLTIMMLLISIMSGCTHDPLCYEHERHVTDIRVNYDWRESPDASPELMLQYFFPLSTLSREDFGTNYLRAVISDISGATLRLHVGSYHAICVSLSNNNIRIVNEENLYTLQITAAEAEYIDGLSNFGISTKSIPRSASTQTEKLITPPEDVWIDRDEYVEVNPGLSQTLTLIPKSPLHTYTLKVLEADNLEYAVSLSGSLASMTGGIYGHNGAQTDQCATILFELEKSTQSGVAIEGKWFTFGHSPEGNDLLPHPLFIYAIMDNGQKYYFEFDVTEQIHNSEDEQNVEIIIDRLPLPKPIVNGGGFHPSVGEWLNQDVVIDI